MSRYRRAVTWCTAIFVILLVLHLTQDPRCGTEREDPKACID